MLNHCVIFAAGLIAYISSRKVNPWLVINSVCKSLDFSRCSVISHQLLQRGRGLDVTGGGGGGYGQCAGKRWVSGSVTLVYKRQLLNLLLLFVCLFVCLFVVFLRFCTSPKLMMCLDTYNIQICVCATAKKMGGGGAVFVFVSV